MIIGMGKESKSMLMEESMMVNGKMIIDMGKESTSMLVDLFMIILVY